MRVKAKVDGELQRPQPNGTIWGVTFTAGEKLTIPEPYFHDDLFVSLEPKAARKTEKS